MRLLFSAYACEPNHGSEPGAGWHWLVAASQVADETVLLTRANNVEAVVESLDAAGRSGIDVVGVDLPRFFLGLKRRFGLTRTYYLLWQYRAARRARAMHASRPFDIAHHMTFAVDWLPAPTTRLSGAARVWGPVGGATSIPKGMRRWLGWRGAITEAVRHVTTGMLRRTVGRKMAMDADIVLVQNTDDQAYFEKFCTTTVLEPNVVAEPNPPIHESKREFPQQAVFVGRLIPWKGLRVLMAALCQAPALDWGLVVVGEGPERARCDELGRRLGLSNRVRFLGRLGHSETLSVVASSDVFVSASMHEAAGFAVAEAIALGRPVVALDHGGPGTLVEPGLGELVVPSMTVASDLAKAISRQRDVRMSGSSRWSKNRIPGILATVYGEAIRIRGERMMQEPTPRRTARETSGAHD